MLVMGLMSKRGIMKHQRLVLNAKLALVALLLPVTRAVPNKAVSQTPISFRNNLEGSRAAIQTHHARRVRRLPSWLQVVGQGHQNATCVLEHHAELLDYGSASQLDIDRQIYEYKVPWDDVYMIYPCKFRGLRIMNMDHQALQPVPDVQWLVQGYYMTPESGWFDWLVDENGKDIPCKVDVNGGCGYTICHNKLGELAGKGGFPCSFVWEGSHAYLDQVTAGHGMSERTQHTSLKPFSTMGVIIPGVIVIICCCCHYGAYRNRSTSEQRQQAG